MKVLLVDDSKTIVSVYSMLLKRLGHDVVSFGDAESAIAACGEKHFDVAILDWVLPGLSGVELCRRIRQMPWGNRCVVLVITSKNKAEDLNEVLDAGADDYIMKPAKEDLFLTRFRIAGAVLKRKRDVAEAREALEKANEHLEVKVRGRTEELEQSNALLKESLKQKDVLLAEIHHRVKNNMAIISSLLSLQSMRISDSAYRDMIKDSQSRIRSMALVHEMLYKSKSLADIGLREYVGSLVENMRSNISISRHVEIKTEVAEMDMDIDTLIPLGLIINELLMNSFKYAFDGQSAPEIYLGIAAHGAGIMTLAFSDNGCGLQGGAPAGSNGGLGMLLIRELSRQIGGELNITNERGAHFRIAFPYKPQSINRIPSINAAKG